MQAVILAAGMGKRLKNLTCGNTKCMVSVNGVTMIERSLRVLDRKGLSRIVVVEGYEGEKLKEYIGTLHIETPILFIHNDVYDKTNNIYSLALAKDYLCMEDTLLLESDLVFEESIIDDLLEDPRSTLAVVDHFESWMDGTCMGLVQEDRITDFIPGKLLKFAEKENYYKTVNIYKFSKHFSETTYVPFLLAYEKAMGENEYYESVIKLIALLETREIRAKRLNGQKWYEIDDIQDLDIAESIFADNRQEQYEKISGRYGGYWRYPKLRDYCYLVNPYFPNAKMLDEMKSNFETLLTNYPSGMRINSLLAANLFDVCQEHIVVGNGAAELIRMLMEQAEGKIGCVCPTFEEYPNRCDPEKITAFHPQEEGCRYTADDLICFYEKNPVDWLILINPDNPSGNYIPYGDLMRLIEWCRTRNMRLVLDESFADFAELSEDAADSDLTLLKDSVLNQYEKLYVMKSISKSYGVPGIRLGVLASSDEALIAGMKREAAIWNINSYGEFFLQIIGKYRKAYSESLVRIRENRKKLMAGLGKISYLKVYPSQANYVMCQLTEGMTAEYLCGKMLEKNILLKNLTHKLHDGKEYVRIAVKSVEDNDLLIGELKKLESSEQKQPISSVY